MVVIRKTKRLLKDINYIFGLDSMGNVPYFSSSLSKVLRELFSQVKNLKVIEDELALYVKVGNNNNQKPIIVDTHLDHPGFVIGENKVVHSLGSFLFSKMINKINFPDKLPVGYYSNSGHLITTGFLYLFEVVGSQITARYQTESNVDLPKNTQVMPIFKTGLDRDILKLRSADNLATVFVCLNLINKLKESEDINITFVFSKIEEIFQFSASGISKRSATPFEKILPNTPIIVLEVAPVLSKTQASNGDLAVASHENNFETLNPDSTIYKQLVDSCREHKVKLHHSQLHSHGNSIAYKLISGNQETICLHAGSFNRHNVDDDHNFAAEYVYLSSLYNLAKVTETMAVSLTKNYPNQQNKAILNKNEKAKKSQLLSAFTRAYPRLKFNKLYPKTILEYIYFAYYTILSRLY